MAGLSFRLGLGQDGKKNHLSLLTEPLCLSVKLHEVNAVIFDLIDMSFQNLSTFEFQDYD
jgi:hypothetical protein